MSTRSLSRNSKQVHSVQGKQTGLFVVTPSMDPGRPNRLPIRQQKPPLQWETLEARLGFCPISDQITNFDLLFSSSGIYLLDNGRQACSMLALHY